MVKHPLFGEVSKDFNEAAAMAVYDGFIDDPEYYAALLHMHAHEVVNKTILESPEIIDSLIIDKYNARKELVKDAILSGVINKSMSNETVDQIVSAMDVIQKSMDQYTSFERAENVKRQRRDVGGRFVKMGTTKVDVPQGVLGRGAGDMQHRSYWDAQTRAYDRVANTRHGRTPPTVRQSASLNAAHSSAYLQVADALKQLDPTDMVMADITYTKRDERGHVSGTATKTKVGMDVEDFISEDEFGSGEIPRSITWYMDSDSAGYGRFDVLTGAGASTDEAFDLVGMGQRSGPAAQKMNQTLGSEYTGEIGGQKYGKLGAVATMIETVGGDRISPQGKAALEAAKYVGQYGSEAEKVLGPTARRTAYRYRGTERKPDDKMDRAIAMSVGGARTINDAHEQLIHPRKVTEQVGLDFEDMDEHSPFIKYWQNQLPKREYVQLHLDSGTTPPSQGVVFDAKGQIITQSVGYGDDHYLPFNLKKLTGANRGEWVRTRTMGGPTTEDIYAALITGTRSVTVVSHSGVYNVEFADDFRGGRRMNDKTRRMVRRYAQLLDTLDAESTTLQKIPPDREAELRALALEEIPGEGKAANEARIARVKELKEVEKVNPTPSKAQRDLWTAEFGQKYAEKVANSGGPDEMTWDGVKANLRIRAQMEADEEFDEKADRLLPWERQRLMEEGAPRVDALTDEEAIERLGATDSYNKFIQGKENEYRTAQRPLKLNGQGYYFALQALQEQFPYAIKRVEWYPTDDIATRDKGYVPHNFNRPKAAKEGFWNPEVEGVSAAALAGDKGIKNLKGQDTGKVAAHHTNYQNYAARQRVGGVPAAPAENAAPAAVPNAPAAPAAAPARNAGRVGGRADATNGVMFAGLTPNADIGNSPAVAASRRRLATNAARDLGDIQITYQLVGQNNSTTVPLRSAGLQGLRILTNTAAYDLNDPAIQDELANEVESLVNRTANVNVQGGVNAVRGMIENNQQGAALLRSYERNLPQGRVLTPTTVNDAINRPQAVWDFSAPGVDGAAFLAGGGRQLRDYQNTLNTDGDIAAVKAGWLRQNDNWELYRDTRLADIVRANNQVADVAAGTYPAQTITYHGRDYNVRDVESLSGDLARETLGIMKVNQLLRLMPGTTEPFTRQTPVAPAQQNQQQNQQQNPGRHLRLAATP